MSWIWVDGLYAEPGVESGDTVYRSERFGLTWSLPPGWKFASATEIAGAPATSGVEMKAARPQGAKLPAALVILTDVVSVIPGKVPGSGAADIAHLEEYAHSWMNAAGATSVQSSRVPVLGVEGIRVRGVRGIVDKERVDLTLVYRGRRRIELRCFSRLTEQDWPCREVFAALKAEDQVEVKQPGDIPRILHLRDSKFGLEFDAPDDNWTAIGPRIGMNGAQVVWLWNNGSRQIDVSAFDVGSMPVQPDEAAFAARMMEHFRHEGMNILVKEATLGGQRCSHLELSKPGGDVQDFFLQKRGSILYGLLVTQATHDPVLLTKARTGFRIRGRQAEPSKAAQPGVAPGGASPRR